MEGGELQGWVLERLLRVSVQIWIHCYAVSLVQEVKGGERVLPRKGIINALAPVSHSRWRPERRCTCTSSLSGFLSCTCESWKLLGGG